MSKAVKTDICRISPELANLAAGIRSRIERVRATAEREADTIGRNLLEARKLATHGQWTPFLEAAGIHPRTAQRFIRFVELSDAGKNTEMLSMTALLEVEATPRPSEDEREDPELVARLNALFDSLAVVLDGIRAKLDAATGDYGETVRIVMALQPLKPFFEDKEGRPIKPSETGDVLPFARAIIAAGAALD